MAELEEQAEALRKQTLLVDGPGMCHSVCMYLCCRTAYLPDISSSPKHTRTADEGDAFLEIQAGAGGRESGDWVEMLLAMYNRWADDKGFEVSLMVSCEKSEIVY
jgi:hypothetical protein